MAARAADAFGDIFGDVFGDIFGASRRGGRSQVFRGADLRYELDLDLASGGLRQDRRDRSAEALRVRDLPRLGRREGQHAVAPAMPAAARATCASRRASSSCSRPARAAAARARSCAIPATPASARAACGARASLSVKVPGGRRQRRSHPPVGRGRGGQERRPGRAICTSKCRCASTPSSSATASI